MPPEIHPSAAIGFERSADAYERGRPDFPKEAVVLLRDTLDLRPERTLLELGPGTGKLTRLLAPSGVAIIGIEPVGGMREALTEAMPGIDVRDAVAEDLPLEPGDADAAVAAQAFHWFDGGRALDELARVLPSTAPLALVWNVRDESEPWVRALTDLIEPYRGDTPSHRSMRWLDAFDGTNRWDHPRRVAFPYRHVTTREGVVDRVLSISFIAALPQEERDRVADGVRALLPLSDEVVFPYRTDVWLSRRR